MTGPRILITGANGFIGRHLRSHFLSIGQDVRCASRQESGTGNINIENIDSRTNWQDALDGIDVIIHLASLTQIIANPASDPLRTFRETNSEGTRRLAEQAANSGVKRLIYISSIKVNGELSGEHPFTPDDDAKPKTAYGISKWEAENALLQIAGTSSLEIVIIRPPMVYGPGVKGNFMSMMKWLKAGIPLPLGSIHNKRSLVGIDNLIDLIITCLIHPAARNQTFLVSDGEDMSTTELLNSLSSALGTPPRIFPCPQSVVGLAAKLAGKEQIAQRLLGNLQVDISKTVDLLEWTPPISLAQGVDQTAEWYLNHP